MKTRVRRQIISEVTQGNNKRLKTSANGGGDIPIDLLFEILSRLSTKSIAICRCVSKPWASMLRLPYFTELFLSRSSARPRFLFACQKKDELFFFSTQPHIVNEKLSFFTATYHMKIQSENFVVRSFSHIRGLVFLRDNFKKTELAISNPSTGEYLTLPKEEMRSVWPVNYFGYDPVEKQYKVLSFSFDQDEPQVMTLGKGEPSWRRIECCIRHSPMDAYCQICINGVLYYAASSYSSWRFIIICFDVKSEKFTFIKYKEKLVIREPHVQAMINCNGKLGLFISEIPGGYVYGTSGSITLWILEDAKKHEWLKRTYVLPDIWQNTVGDSYTRLRIVGVAQTEEIVLSADFSFAPFHIFFYNTKRQTIRKIIIKGLERFEPCKVLTYLDHVEDVKLMQMD